MIYRQNVGPCNELKTEDGTCTERLGEITGRTFTIVPYVTNPRIWNRKKLTLWITRHATNFRQEMGPNTEEQEEAKKTK